jgi:regulatory protein
LRERGADEALIDRFLTFPNTFWIERVRAVRARRYGDVLPRDAGERQRQARFLASRGFAGDLIRRAFEVD